MAARPTLYLLPGLLCDAYTFEHQKRALEGDFDVRVLDFFGLDSMTAMAQRVLDEAPARFSVCGFSMGGRVALQILRLAPERLERMCLLDTGVVPPGPGEPAARQVLVDLAYKEGMDAVCAAWLPPMLHPDRRKDPAFMGPLGDMVRRANAMPARATGFQLLVTSGWRSASSWLPRMLRRQFERTSARHSAGSGP
jgi:pimeloyl-ACP methyl ester carboxylesterase